MKTKLLLLLLLANFSIYAQYTNIPDINFENKLIGLGYDSGAPDGKVLTVNIENIQRLQMQSSSISDLTGIENFKNLTDLDIANNSITNLDVSKNTFLTSLQCQRNNLNCIDVSNNTKLAIFNCGENNITTLDVSNNLELNYLYCHKNLLTSLDITKNALLDDVYLNDNKLTSIDLSHNPLLLSVFIGNNYLSNLDISNNTKIIALNVAGNQLSSLDLTNHKNLSELHLNNNNLTELNLRNGNNPKILLQFLDLKDNPNLLCIQVDNISYANTNWSDKKDATAIFKGANCTLEYTSIPDINFEKKLISKGLDSGIPDGKVFSNDIASVKSLDIYNSQIKDLTGIEGFTNLEVLYCSNNELTTLDFSNNLKLKQVECFQNKLTSLNVSKNTELRYLDCFSNQLTALDLSQNKLLQTVYCYSNLLTSLNVTGLTALESLDCMTNQLTSLDVSTNKNLKQLYCLSNKLTSLDVSKNPALYEVSCYSNELTSLNLKNGNNKNFALSNYVKFTNNPNLTCIQVDDADYANANWSSFKDSTSNFNNECSEFYTFLPDANFEQKLIDLGIDKDGLNGKTSKEDVASVTFLDVADSNISDLTGLSDFTSLVGFFCDRNQITSIDLSKNIMLENIGVLDNKLTSIDVRNNTKIHTLEISKNQITSIDLSQNINLKRLGFDYNEIEEIDLTQNKELWFLTALGNKLTILDLSQNEKLEIVQVSNNELTTINLQNGNNENLLIENPTNKKNNSALFTSFLNNPNLKCIQVDDVDFSNANWSHIKEATTSYSSSCKSLGTEDLLFSKIVMYPNPTKGEVNIQNAPLEKATVYNALGQLVKSFTLNSANTDHSISLSGLPKGIYYVYLISGDAASAKKVIVE